MSHKEEIYSYHNFLYPFSYEDDEIYNEIKKWPKKKFNENENIKYYNNYQYFNEKARNLISSANDGKCRDFQMYKDFKNHVFKIYLCDDLVEKKEESPYILNIIDVSIKIFHEYKIAILSINLVNNEYNDIRVIKNINDYGRRVFLPCIFDKKDDRSNTVDNSNDFSSITASRIAIVNSNDDSSAISMNFETEIKILVENEIKQKELINKNIIKQHSTKFICKIIYKNNDIGNKINVNDSNYAIRPILDDRMFVASMIHYDFGEFGTINELFKDTIENIPYCIKKDLYPILFLDHSFSTCQNESLLNELFNRHLYLRWTDYGALDCITEYGFVKLTSGMKVPSVGPPFLNMYTEMMKIALLQRCKLEAIEIKISKLELSKKDEIDNIWKEFITYKKELGMKVLTFQEQGVECYDILRKSLKIDEIEIYVDDEMKKIHEYIELQKQNERIEQQNKRINQQDKMQEVIKLLTIITVIIGAESLISGLFINYFSKTLKSIYTFLIIVINIIFLYKTYGAKKKDELENIIIENTYVFHIKDAYRFIVIFLIILVCVAFIIA